MTSGAAAFDPGGFTYAYTDFDMTQFGELYFGISSPTPRIGESSGQPMQFVGVSDGVFVYENMFQILNEPGKFFETVAGRFELTISDRSGRPLPEVSAEALGLTPAIGALHQVTGNFNATLEFFINGTAASTFYGNYDTNPRRFLLTQADGGFFSTPPTAVPLLGAIGLLLGGLGGLL